MTDTMKKLAASLLVACALCLALTGTAWAATDPAVVLEKEDGGAVAVALQLPAGQRDDVRALRLELAITGDGLQNVAVDFAFDALPAGVTVKEARYSLHDGAGRLNLYVAGTANLFASETLSLGRASLSSDDAATVEVSAEALDVANAAHDAASPALAAAAPVTVELGALAPPTPPEGGGTEEGDDGSDGDDGDDGQDNGSSDANRSPGAPSGTVQTLEPTSDGLALPTAAFAAAALCAAGVLALVRRGRMR